MTMKLKSLSIRACESWEEKNGFIGTVVMESPNGKVETNIGDEACRKMIMLVAEGMVEAAESHARELRETVTPALLGEVSDD